MWFRHKTKVEEPIIDNSQSEVTEIFVKKTEKGLVNYHETFMSSEDHCEYKGKRYNEPIESTQHYGIGFWNWGRKLSMHYSQHTTQARFLDWFHFAANVSYPVGYIHEEGNAEPLDLKVKNVDNFFKTDFIPIEDNASINWAQINHAISQNTTIEGMHEDVDYLLSGEHKTNWNPLLIVLIVAIAITVCVIGAFYFLGGNHGEVAQGVTNITATIRPGA